ncbi:MAG: hypothetical protein AAB792_01960, partial [Patescibacteria group bacterium]
MPQPLLLATIKDEPEKVSRGMLPSGPVFDFGPGWGFYVKKWLKKYFLKIFVPVMIIIVAIGVFTARKGAENEKRPAEKEIMTVVIVRGDSRALLARKALVEYLKENPEESLSNGQKLFIEE